MGAGQSSDVVPYKGAVLLIRGEEGKSTPYLVESTDPHARTVSWCDAIAMPTQVVQSEVAQLLPLRKRGPSRLHEKPACPD